MLWWIPQMMLFHFKRQYFPARLVVEQQLDASRPHVLGLHPHGVISLGVLCNIVYNADGQHEELGGEHWSIRVATVSFNFVVPLWRDLVMGLGFIDASRASLRAALAAGHSVGIVVGGAVEALRAHAGVVELTLNRRRGFVRLALESGAPLVPVFTFGENEAFEQLQAAESSWLYSLQREVRNLVGFTMPIVWGRGVFQYSFGSLPKRVPLVTVVGRPLELPHIAAPTKADVDEWHAVYVHALQELYDRHKEAYYPVELMPEGRPQQPPELRIVE